MKQFTAILTAEDVHATGWGWSIHLPNNTKEYICQDEGIRHLNLEAGKDYKLKITHHIKPIKTTQFSVTRSSVGMNQVIYHWRNINESIKTYGSNVFAGINIDKFLDSAYSGYPIVYFRVVVTTLTK